MGTFWVLRFVHYFLQGVDNTQTPPSPVVSAASTASAVQSSLFSALPRLPGVRSCPAGGTGWGQWVHTLEFAFAAFLLGVVVGCLGGGVARTVFWFQMVPLVLGASLVYVAVYIL